MTTPHDNGSRRPDPAPRKPTLDELESIDYDAEDVGYGRLLLWPILIIGALGLLALAVNGMNFLGPY